MPYVKQEQRPQLDTWIGALEKIWTKYEHRNWPRFLSKLCALLKPSYNTYKNFLGEINECAAEIRRRFTDIIHDTCPNPLDDFDVTGAEREELAAYCRELAQVIKYNGDFNYFLYTWFVRYGAYDDGIAKELEDTVKKLRTRYLAPYEDEKIEENGDIKK